MAANTGNISRQAAGEDIWIDVSVELNTGMVHWPGDPEPTFHRVMDMDHGEVANITLCRMGAHTGTHMDAPCHFVRGGRGIDEFPLDVAIGPAKVIAMPADVGVIGRRELQAKGIEGCERVLFKTKNSDRRWDNQEFATEYVGINQSGAEFLTEAGVKLVGVDYLSVGVFEGDSAETHRVLLGAGAWIVEGLNLVGVSEGLYDLICLPLRIAGSDGAPARVVLKRRD